MSMYPYGKCGLCRQKAEILSVKETPICVTCLKALYDTNAPYEELLVAVAFGKEIPDGVLGAKLRENLKTRGVSEEQFKNDVKEFIQAKMHRGDGVTE